MALVPISIDRTSKPPLGTPLRTDGHWSVQDIVIASAFNEFGGTIVYDAANQKPMSTNADWVADGLQFTSANSDCIITNDDAYGSHIANRGETLIISLISTGNGAIPVASRSSSTGNGFDMLINAVTPGTVSGRIQIAGTPLATVNDTYRINTPQVLGLVMGYDYISTIVNGRLGQPRTISGDAIKTQSLSVAKRGTNYQDFQAQFFLYYHRPLSPSQIQSICRNPWQIYEPEIKWVWVEDGASASYTQAVSGVYPAPSGEMTYFASFLEPLTGAFPAPSGNISKHIGKSVSGAFSAPSGDTVKGTSKNLIGTFPAPSGTPGESISVHKAVSGIMGAIVGAVTTILNPIIDITSRAVKIIGSSFKRMIGG